MYTALSTGIFYRGRVVCVYTHTQYILPLSRLSIFFIDEKKHTLTKSFHHCVIQFSHF